MMSPLNSSFPIRSDSGTLCPTPPTSSNSSVSSPLQVINAKNREGKDAIITHSYANCAREQAVVPPHKQMKLTSNMEQPRNDQLAIQYHSQPNIFKNQADSSDLNSGDSNKNIWVSPQHFEQLAWGEEFARDVTYHVKGDLVFGGRNRTIAPPLTMPQNLVVEGRFAMENLTKPVEIPANLKAESIELKNCSGLIKPFKHIQAQEKIRVSGCHNLEQLSGKLELGSDASAEVRDCHRLMKLANDISCRGGQRSELMVNSCDNIGLLGNMSSFPRQVRIIDCRDFRVLPDQLVRFLTEEDSHPEPCSVSLRNTNLPNSLINNIQQNARSGAVLHLGPRRQVMRRG